VLIVAPKFPQYQYGDILKISGKLEMPYPQDYYFKRGIRGEIKNPDKLEKVGSGGNFIVKNIYKVGSAFETALTKILPEPYAAFQDGLILGTKINIPDSLMSEFNRTGTTHIVAVSGYNVTIIIMFISYLLMRFSRKISFFGSMFTIIVFVILTGAVASVLRAGILMALVIFAKFIGRRPYYPILILLVADAMLLFNPYALKNDISFQLSFLAFTGLIFFSPKIEQIKFIKDSPEGVKKAFSETMGAQIAVLPILLFNFGILSFVAPLANILILPVVPLSMFLGFLAGIGGLAWLELGRILGLVAWIPLKYIIAVENLLSKVPGAAVTLKIADWWWIPVYYLLIYVFFRGKFGLNQQSDDQNYREQEEF
jgi:competence protein ComEC